MMMDTVTSNYIQNKLKKVFSYLVTFSIIIFFMSQVSSCYPLIGWPLRAVQRPIYKHTFGHPFADIDVHNLNEEFIPFNDPHPSAIVDWGGYRIQKTFVSKYRVSGWVAYLDTNDALIKGYYLGTDEVSRIYKKVAPYDLYLVFGKMANPQNLKKFRFSHSENMGHARMLDSTAYYNQKEISNYHINPATANVRRALSVVQQGDYVYMEGYLVDWREIQNYSTYVFRTARYPGEAYSRLPGGRSGAGLCKQLYLTKIGYNNAVYY